MAKFRKKPLTINAFQFFNDDENCVLPRWFKETHHYHDIEAKHMVIVTAEGRAIVGDGDWIIKGVEGEVYSCKKSVFEKTYEEIDGLKKKAEINGS